MKPKRERWDWILANIPDHGIDVLASEFVDRYIDATGAGARFQIIGAHVCPQLGKDMAAMSRVGLLRRARVGISGVGVGFPRWVFVYSRALPATQELRP